jgi:hypothetical protein
VEVVMVIVMAVMQGGVNGGYGEALVMVLVKWT